MSVQGYALPAKGHNLPCVVDNVGEMVAVAVVAVAQGDADGGETGWVVSRLSQGAGVTLVAPGVVALSCGFADYVVVAEANW